MQRQYSFRLLFTVLLLCCSTLASADTIDFYHVYYNEEIIEMFNQHHIGRNNIVSLDTAKIKESDSMKVMYWDDTPCNDCKIYLKIYSPNYYDIGYTIINTGVGNLLSFSLRDLFFYSRKYKIFEYEIRYFEENASNERTLFFIKLE
jgi:hypothetical protein